MSESNNVSLRIVPEVTFGSTPSAPAFQNLKYRSSSLKYEPQTVLSDEITGDDQITDNTLVGYSVSGDVQARLTFGALDDLIAANLYSSWVTRANTVPTAVAAGSYTTTSFANHPVASLVYGSGFANAANNGVKEVTTSAANAVSAAGLVLEASPPAGAKIQFVGVAGGSGAIAAVAGGLTGVPTIAALVAGDWIKIGGSAVANKFATAACNGYARVSSVFGTTVNFDIFPDGWTTDAGTGKTIWIFVSERIRNGNTRTSYTVEREYLLDGGSYLYEYFAGCVFGQWAMRMQPRQNIEVSFEVMGLTATSMSNTRFASATTVAAPASALLNTSSNIGRIRLGATTMTGASSVTKADLMVDRNLREREGVGSQASIDIRKGRCNVKVELSAYFTSETLLNAVRTDTETSYDSLIRNAARTQAYVIDVPRGKYSTGTTDTGAIDTDVTVDLTFQGLQHPTLGYTIQVSRFIQVQE